MSSPDTLPEITDTPYSTVKAPPANGLKRHVRWPEIHADIVTSSLTPREICEKYDLRTESGSLAVLRVSKYRKEVLEKYKDIFAAANELEQQAIRGEVLGKIRHVFDAAAQGHELAKSQKTLIGRGKNVTLVDAPDFSAMKEQQDSMLNAGTRLAELAGISGKAPAQAPMYQDNRQVTILALPKQDGVSSRAPLKIVEAQKSA
jgi:hypothetical protein